MALFGNRRLEIFCLVISFGSIALIPTVGAAPQSCPSGFFGDDCKSECHCYGKQCDNKADVVVCLTGCDLGWTGPACSIAKQDVEVKYVCVNSPIEGRYAYVRFDTGGVTFEVIDPINDEGKTMHWCGTNIQQNPHDSSTTIKIPVNNRVISAINKGQCPGKSMGDEKFQWKVRIQETEGLVSRNDMDIEFECDFKRADAMELSDEQAIKKEKFFRPNDVRKHVKRLTEEKEKVTMSVINPSNGKSASKHTKLGTPVAIKFSFGSGSDKATGVLPSNCRVSAEDGTNSKMLVDRRGCPIQDSIITGFHKASSRSVVSNSFSLTGLKESSKVVFKCSYDICFGDDPCKPNCDLTTPGYSTDTTHEVTESSWYGDYYGSSSTIRMLQPRGFDPLRS